MYVVLISYYFLFVDTVDSRNIAMQVVSLVGNFLFNIFDNFLNNFLTCHVVHSNFHDFPGHKPQALEVHVVFLPFSGSIILHVC